MDFYTFIHFFLSCSLSFSLFYLLLSSLITRLTSLVAPTRQCECQICQDFLSRNWTKKFHNISDWYSDLLQKSPTGTIHIHVANNIITANPENVEHMLKTRFHNYPKGKQFSAILGDLLGQGIFNVDGHSWKFQRKLASLELGSVSVRSYAFRVISSEIQTRFIPLIESFSDHERVVDLQDVFRRFAFDTICRFSFGLDPGCLRSSLPESEFASAFDKASRLSAERAMTASPLVWKMKRFFNLGSEKELRSAIRSIDVLAGEVIKQKKEMGTGQIQNDLLSRFMSTISDDDYLRDIVVSFLLAGRDTIASGLTSLFWLLAQNREIVSMIREEAERVMGQSDTGLPTFEQLQKMNYLQAAVYESLRIFPPVQFDSKFASQPDVLPDGSFVKSGTRVTYHPYAMGRMEKIWGSDCLEFKPERWLSDGIFTPVNPFKFSVFQAGNRVCLGKEMAVVEMKLVAVSFIRRFDIELAAPSDQSMLRFSPGLTATVSGGLPVVIQRRRDSEIIENAFVLRK
ncbi:cytochrome P450 94C1-like [Impatiens glandulifera]|uniref:cytochrome P450 94C1-like n=1 Tax=Impatiens glandulifera TaxID=253017 RepID=UPI001FB0AA3D|nr:cytochrome P450 94C1-like [Impatiens glandulifera]